MPTTYSIMGLEVGTMAPEHPSRSEISRRVHAVPLVEDGSVIDEPTALATLEDLRKDGSQLLAHLRCQIELIIEEIGDKLEPGPEGTKLITLTQVRGLVARSAIAGFSQAVNDIGQTTRYINEFRAAIGITDNVVSINPESTDNPDIPPGAA